jgi:hypothetical protein
MCCSDSDSDWKEELEGAAFLFLNVAKQRKHRYCWSLYLTEVVSNSTSCSSTYSISNSSILYKFSQNYVNISFTTNTLVHRTMTTVRVCWRVSKKPTYPTPPHALSPGTTRGPEVWTNRHFPRRVAWGGVGWRGVAQKKECILGRSNILHVA